MSIEKEYSCIDSLGHPSFFALKKLYPSCFLELRLNLCLVMLVNMPSTQKTQKCNSHFDLLLLIVALE